MCSSFEQFHECATSDIDQLISIKAYSIVQWGVYIVHYEVSFFFWSQVLFIFFSVKASYVTHNYQFQHLSIMDNCTQMCLPLHCNLCIYFTWRLQLFHLELSCILLFNYSVMYFVIWVVLSNTFLLYILNITYFKHNPGLK